MGANRTRSGRFQKGASGNPAGRPSLPEELQAVRKLTPTYINALLSKFAHWTLEDLKNHVKKKDVPAIESYVCSLLYLGIAEGDPRRWEVMLNRAIGKVPDEVNVAVARTITVKRPNGDIVEMG